MFDEPVERLDLLPALVRYLDHSAQLASIQTALDTVAQAVPDQQQSLDDSFSSFGSTVGPSHPQLTLKPIIQVAQVGEVCLNLAKYIMEEPRGFRRLLQQLVVKLGRSEGAEVELGRVVVIPSFSSLLPFYEHEVTSERWLGGMRDSPKLWSLKKGRLVAISERVKFVSSATYSCPQTSCMWRGEDEAFVKVFTPGQGSVVGKPPECHGCGSPLQEQFSKRDVSERVTGLLLVESSGHTLTAVFRHEEAAMLQLGKNYSIVFTLVHERRGSGRQAILEVCGTEQLQPSALRHLELTEGQLQIPRSVTRLHQACNDPYTFVRILASQIGSVIDAPRFALFQLRLGILLSLATQGARLPLLVVGPDLVLAHRLLRAALQLCPQPIVYSHQVPLSAVMARDANGAHCLQAGQLQRADDGVVYLGQLAALKASVRQEVLSVVEIGATTCPPLPRCPPTQQPLTAALWATAEGSSSVIQKSIKDFVSFCNLFGLVVHPEVDDETIVQHCLFSSYDNLQDSPRVSSEDLAAFLEQVRFRKVSLTESCRSLLTGYFLASRRSRRGSDVPQTALATLLSIAEAHAKLALRHEAVEEDGVAACHFYETSLAAQLGHSLLEPPAFNFSSLAELVGSVAKEEMEMFHRRLIQFVENFAPREKEKVWENEEEGVEE